MGEYPDPQTLSPGKILKKAGSFLNKADYGAALYYVNCAFQEVENQSDAVNDFLTRARNIIESAKRLIGWDLEARLAGSNVKITAKNMQMLLSEYSPHQQRYEHLINEFGNERYIQ